MAKKNIIDFIEEEMKTDEADRDKQQIILKARYKKATPEERKAINDVMICICGWGMDTIINGH